MSKQYIKTGTGKEVVAKPKIKVFESVSELETAIANGDVTEGEIVSTKFTDNGTGGDLAADLQWLADGLNHVEEILDDMDLDSKQNVELSETIASETTVEGALSAINDKADTNAGAIASINSDITTINNKIKNTASASDQLIPESEIDAKLPVYTLDTTTSTLTITLN